MPERMSLQIRKVSRENHERAAEGGVRKLLAGKHGFIAAHTQAQEAAFHEI
jgi:hypothetical protein